MAPVAAGIEIAEIELLLQPHLDPGRRAGDLARDKRFAATRRFVIKEYAVAGEQIVRLAIIDRYEIAVCLCATVGGARIERRGFGLRFFQDFSKHL